MVRRLDDADYARLLEIRTGLRRFLRWSEQQAAAAGLTPAQHQLLLAIRGHRGPDGLQRAPTIGDVAEHLLLRHHSAVELVDRAAAAGLVERRPDPSDQRQVLLVLTPAGAQRLEHLSALHVEEMSRLGAALRPLTDGLRPSTHGSGPSTDGL
jgi:DNA-binding MarR family transcriptional regulator